jgi:hypothetical protein
MATTTLPAASYINDASRTEGEAKQFFEDLRQVIEEMPGSVASTELTISSGNITPSQGYHSVDTEADAASDDLTTISTTNMADGRLLLLHSVTASRDVVIKHAAGGSGQIHLVDGHDVTLADSDQSIILQRRGADWYEVSRFFSLVSELIILRDVKATGTDGGALTGATWNIRTLNTIVQDDTGDVTLAANRFTLPAGTYEYEIRAPGRHNTAAQHRIKLVKDPAGAPVNQDYGSCEHSTGAITWSRMEGKITLTASTTFEIQHYITGTQTTNGAGASVGDGASEYYTVAKFRRVAR